MPAPRRLSLALPLLLAGCGGPQSTLLPAGTAAEQIATLWWWMAGGAVLIWLLVVGLTVYAIRVDPGPHGGEQRATWLVIGGGAVFPTVVLAGLLLYALRLMPGLLAPGAGGMEVHVTGEEWWWRVEYVTAEGDTVPLANEIRLPVGRRTEFTLTSPDVIHSFWIPSLGGKIDMIPGRTNRLALEPTRTGTFRGTCAEYCGSSHAFMSFVAVVMEPEAFDAWLEEQARPVGPDPSAEDAGPVTAEQAGPPGVAGVADSVVPEARSAAGAAASPAPIRGREAFLANGCGACHTVRGTPADGRVGPDLTHVGGRETLAAGMLPNDVESFHRWISAAQELKPGVHMPSFGMLPESEVRAMAAWLDGLR